MPDAQKAPCAHCGAELTLPPFEMAVVNQPLFSQLMLLHPDGMDCQSCGGHNQVAIEQARITKLLIVRAERRNRIIGATQITNDVPKLLN